METNMQNNMNIDKNLFEPLNIDETEKNVVVRPSETYWQDAWRRLKENKVAIVSLVMLVFLAVISIFGPMISKFNYYSNNMNVLNINPNSVHYFGTDELGRDLYVRVLYGMRISLAVGIVSAFINFVIGVIYGGISGFLWRSYR
jgi:oligopeptide transport system permease protein